RNHLRTAAKGRGLADFGLTFAEGAFETLDREDIFVPVAYARHGFWFDDQPSCLDDGDLQIREEVGYRPWTELREQAETLHGDEANLYILYHHWQLLWLRDLQTYLTPGVLGGNLSDGLDVFFEMRARAAAPPKDARQTLSQAASAWG